MKPLKDFIFQLFCSHDYKTIYQIHLDCPAERLKETCYKCGKINIEPLTFSNRKICLNPSDSGWILENEIYELPVRNNEF